jgi:ABC-type Fe3+-hydroxamate transport system substrate-binding protein
VVDIEKVVAADPDLVLAAGNEATPSTVIDQLTSLGYPVLSLYPRDLERVYDDLALVGEALDARDAAAAVVNDLRAREEAVVSAVAGALRPRTFYEVGIFEGSIYTAGEDSFRLAHLAGGRGSDCRRPGLDRHPARGPDQRGSRADPARGCEL